jgi:hypothetical protein
MTAEELTNQAQMAFEQALPDDATPYDVGQAFVKVGEHLAACLAEEADALTAELLNALVLMQKAYNGPHIEDDTEWCRTVDEADAKCAAAIAKATGADQ